jgi:predicted Rossmann-fold nucleotide-binding protein
LHDKPIIVVDIGGYWAPLAALFEHIVEAQFAAPVVPDLIRFVPDVPALFAALRAPR